MHPKSGSRTRTRFPSGRLTRLVESSRPADVTAHEHAGDTQQNGDNESTGIAAGHQKLGNHTDHQTRRDAPVRNMDFQSFSDLLLRDLLFPPSRTHG